MDTLIGIVVLAVIVGAIVLYQKAMGALGAKANQKVFLRKSHREGEELVSQPLVFSARGSSEEVRKAVLATVKVATQVPAVIADAYVIESTDSFILYGYGNRLDSQNFRGLLSFKVTDNGVQGVWEILNWTRGDGIVEGQSVMKRLVADINTALRSVDPNAVLRPA